MNKCPSYYLSIYENCSKNVLSFRQPSVYLSESGCKGRDIFNTHQNFYKLFLKEFLCKNYNENTKRNKWTTYKQVNAKIFFKEKREFLQNE